MYAKARNILNSFDGAMIKKLLMTKQRVDIRYAFLIIKTAIKKYIDLSNAYFELLMDIIKITASIKNVIIEYKKKMGKSVSHLNYEEFYVKRKKDQKFKDDVNLLMEKVKRMFLILLDLDEKKKKIKELHFFFYIYVFKFCCDKNMFINYFYNGVDHFHPFNFDVDDLYLREGDSKGFMLLHFFFRDSLITELYSENIINDMISNYMNNKWKLNNIMNEICLKEYSFYTLLTAILYYIEQDYCFRKKTNTHIKIHAFFYKKNMNIDVTFFTINPFISKIKKIVALLDNDHLQ